MEYQNLDQYKTPKGFRGRSAFIVQLWRVVYAVFFKHSPQFLYGWRRFILRCFGAQVGKNVIIRPSAQITYPWKLNLGDHCWIGDEVVLYTLGPITIGANAVISQRSYLCTGSHDYRSPHFDIYAKPIHIAEKCWLATDVYVAPGVSVGAGTVIGARSSVFKNVPAGKVCIGSPLVILKDRIE